MRLRNKHFNFRNDENGKKVIDLFIWDEIDEFWGVSKKSVLQQIRDEKPDVINLHISSLGGDVNSALAIKQILKGHNAKVIAWLTGLVASSATVIMLSADEINMSEDSMVLIHDVQTGQWGNKDDHRMTANMLEQVDSILVSGYVKKTGNTEKVIRDQMKLGNQGIWMTPNEAMDFGLVDNVVAEIKLVAKYSLTSEKFTNNKLTIPMKKKFQVFANTHIQTLIDRGQTRDEILNDIAEELQIERSLVDDFMSGKTEPSADQIKVFASAMDFKVEEFTAFKGEPETTPAKPKEQTTVVGKDFMKSLLGGFKDVLVDAGIMKKGDKPGVVVVDDKSINIDDLVNKVVEKMQNVTVPVVAEEKPEQSDEVKKLMEKVHALEQEALKGKTKPTGKGKLKGEKPPFDSNDESDTDDSEPDGKEVSKNLQNQFK